MLESVPDRLAAHITERLAHPHHRHRRGPRHQRPGARAATTCSASTTATARSSSSATPTLGGDIAARGRRLPRRGRGARLSRRREHSYAMADEEWDAFRGRPASGWPAGRCAPRAALTQCRPASPSSAPARWARFFGRAAGARGAGVTVGGTWPRAWTRIARRGARWRASPTWSARRRAAAGDALDRRPTLVLVLVKSRADRGRSPPMAARAVAPGGVDRDAPERPRQPRGAGARRSARIAWPSASPTLGATLLGARPRPRVSRGRVAAGGAIALAARSARRPRCCARGPRRPRPCADLEPHVWRKLAVNCAHQPADRRARHRQRRRARRPGGARARGARPPARWPRSRGPRGVALPGDPAGRRARGRAAHGRRTARPCCRTSTAARRPRSSS